MKSSTSRTTGANSVWRVRDEPAIERGDAFGRRRGDNRLPPRSGSGCRRELGARDHCDRRGIQDCGLEGSRRGALLAGVVQQPLRDLLQAALRGVIKEGAPTLPKFVTQIAARFGLVVTQKLGAQALPVVGALWGAAVNYAFIEHFHLAVRWRSDGS